jgi:hypothetical protein
MTKAIESFKSYLITESYKGPDQLRLAQYQYRKPETFKKTFERSGVSLYDEPETMDKEDSVVSKEDDARLKELGLIDNVKIEYMSAHKLELEYDIIMVWDTVGVETMLFIPKRLRLVVDVETWDEIKDTSISTFIEIIDDNIGDRFEWDDSRQPFPIEPTSIDIHMNKSFDASQFKYEFTIGEWR